MHPGVKAVKHKSISSLWSFCRAHYIIRTHSFWDGIFVPGRQVMCYSFHGMGIKGFEKDLCSKFAHNSFEHFNVTSELFAKMFSENLNADIDRFDITGLPRNDYLFVQPIELLNLMNLSSYNKLLIWMPTFRENKLMGNVDGRPNESGLPVISKSGLEKLNDELKHKNYCLMIKLHQWAAECVNGNWSNIRILTDKDIPDPYTLYHFLGLMDVLLTDYSSVSTDFLLLNRPIGYVYDDLEEFRKSRYLPLDPIEQYMAGARINTEQQLFDFLNDLEDDSWANERERVANLFLNDRDAGSTERYLKAIGLI
jgi:CDP-glycerol glycerophosphotransferase (TagB/SpsB family)